MALLTQGGPSSSMSRQGSHVAIAVQGTEQVDISAQTAGPAPTGTLHLHGGPRNRPRVVWNEDVVDNEGLGRKKSKICCIYHRPRQFDESSDEDSSGTESESDEGSNARPSHHRHRHAHDGECEAEPRRDPEDKLRGGSDDRNAYEQMPPHKGKGKVTS